MILLTISNGILKEVNKENELWEMKKDNWQYRLTTASRDYTIIDYDKDLARPYVKAILAKVNKLKEVKMLWAVLIIMVFFYLSFIALFFVQYFRISDLQKIMSNIPTQKVNNIQQQINPAFDSIWQNIWELRGTTSTGTNIPIKSTTNHLLR